MEAFDQLAHLAKYPSFQNQIPQKFLKGSSLRIFQINIGKWCNQTCRHCHVDAGPRRTESMSLATAEKCISWLAKLPEVEVLDLTGGAPEGHEAFRFLVQEARRLGKRVIDRCNLTILSEPGFEWLGEFLQSNQVEVISSLPYFASSLTDKQRGNGVFERSIAGLKQLNSLGYGKEIPLDLVYNPSGILLSGSQIELEKEFKMQLQQKFGIEFNQLFCINNMPVSRFLESLLRAQKLDLYMEKLIQAYNPATLSGLMCRHQINIGWDGNLYDCDFNQMLELKAKPYAHIDKLESDFAKRNIQLYNHCYGCTAGSGSSCGGEVI